MDSEVRVALLKDPLKAAASIELELKQTEVNILKNISAPASAGHEGFPEQTF